MVVSGSDLTTSALFRSGLIAAMNLSEVCASAYCQKAAMNQFGLLAPTISEIGLEQTSEIFTTSIWRSVIVINYRVDLNLDQPVRVDEATDLHNRIYWKNIFEVFSTHFRYLLPI